jgi:hypothetical protein
MGKSENIKKITFRKKRKKLVARATPWLIRGSQTNPNDKMRVTKTTRKSLKGHPCLT